MSLQLILGNSGAGKSHYLYEYVIQEAKKYPEQKFLILVPEQFTMQTQKELVTMHPDGGILNIDILSFQRLAYRVFEEVGNYKGILLEETGKSLVLQKVAQQKKKELQVLGQNLKKPGYINEMKSLISEFMQYQIDPEELEEIQELTKDHPMLNGKLQDVKIIYQGFCEYLEEKYITSEEVLDILCEVISKSKIIKDSTIVLDGFTGFTPIQNKLIKELLNYAKRLMVTVTIDRRENIFKESKNSLFSMSRKTIQTLYKIAQMQKTEIQEEIWITPGSKSRFANAKALNFLEQNLFRYGRKTYRGKQEEIKIFFGKNPQEEVQFAARTISSLIRKNHMRYRDMAVVTGDMAGYGPYVKQIFSQMEIPLFVDEKHKILMNPFIESIRAVLDIIVEDYGYEGVFRYLRCGMTNLEKHEIDELENYVIALGIRGGKKWQEMWTRHYRGMNPDKVLYINELRQKVMEELSTFTEEFRRKDATVLERTTALYQFLVQMQMQEKLEQRESYFQEHNQKAMAREYAQIYGMMMSLLDKMVDILSDEIISPGEYKTLLEAGLEEIKIGIIPPGADQVLFGDIERTRLKDVKVLFFVGVNDGIIPKAASSSSILSEIEREYLTAQDVELAPTSRENMYIQKFYLYLNLTKPKEKLYLSYSQTSAKGETLTPAYLVSVLQNLYPDLTVTPIVKPGIAEIENIQDGWNLLIEGLTRVREGASDSEWEELYSWYFDREEYRPHLLMAVDAAFYRNPHDWIGQTASTMLYGDVLINSATRLEKFAACAYAHFLQFGLRLQPRQEYEFSPADMGNIIHQSLEWFSKKLEQSSYAWESLTEEQAEELVEESITEVIRDYGNTILYSSSRNEYMIWRVKRIMNRTIWALQEQIRRGDFRPSSFEVNFSYLEDLNAAMIELPNQKKMRLLGQIDRMDICEDDGRLYVRIIDYKTGIKKFDLVEFYYGLQLQLMLYMNAAVEIEKKRHPDKEVIPAGILYYQVRDPLVDAVSGETLEGTKTRILQELKMNGLVSDEPKILDHLDTTMAQNKKSDIIPVSIKKDGNISAASSTVNTRNFESLSKYSEKKLKEIGVDMINGDVKVNPYKLGTKDACTYCPYRSVCGYDERIPGYSHRNLKSFKKEDLLEIIKAEVEKWQ